MRSHSSDHAPSRIIALGLSAGGSRAAAEFFEKIPAHTGLAFVVIDHKLEGADYSLQRYYQAHTGMAVVPIEDGLVPRANTVYVLSSEADVTLRNGAFRCVERPDWVVRSNISSFFASMARSEGSYAVAILLSGMLRDGTEGMRAIQEQGGTNIVQDPDSAAHPSMPQAAIDAEVEDMVLTPSEMAAFVIQEYVDSDFLAQPMRARKDNLIKYFGNLDALLGDLHRPILVLDKDLKIVGFGGDIQELLPLIDGDIGRPVSDLRVALDYTTLAADARDIIASSGHKEIQVADRHGKTYLLRISAGQYAPSQEKTLCLITLMPLDEGANESSQTRRSLPQVATYGIVLAHADATLRYTWVLNPHPDFSAQEIIGRSDVEIVDNVGTHKLMAQKQRVLTTGAAEEQTIRFPLSNGEVSYRIAVDCIRDVSGLIIGVSSVGVELA